VAVSNEGDNLDQLDLDFDCDTKPLQAYSADYQELQKDNPYLKMNSDGLQ